MAKKSIFKELADKMIDDESKKKIKKAYNELKKECNVLLDEAGIKTAKEEKKTTKVKKVSQNETLKKEEKTEDIKIKKLKENVSIIFCFEILISMSIFSFAMVNFIEGNVIEGLFLIWIIPFMIFITILLCLKYANLKFSDHLKFLTDKMSNKTNAIIKKLEKIVKSDAFILTVFMIWAVVFMIIMFAFVSTE